MVAGRGYFVDTSSGQITMTLPASAVTGDTIAIKDYAANFDTNKITIGRNGHNIQGTATDATIDSKRASVELVYIDSTKGWLFVIESNVSSFSPFIIASGGTETTSGDYKIHTFTGDGNFVVSDVGPSGAGNTVSLVVVAGGGGSGSGGANCSAGGGGGAGGFRESREPSDPYSTSPLNNAGGLAVTAQTYPITVGGGGSAGAIPTNDGTNGSNSVFSTITSAGGGHGGSYPASPGGNGGSGGGGGCNLSTGGSGNTPPVSPPQGNNGYVIPGAACFQNGAGGGGGGATAVGGASSGGPSFNGNGGAGGAGATTSITGSPVAYAGGGGGGGNNVAGAASPCGTGGVGAKGSSPGTDAAAGTANKGGGAGGGAHKSGQPPSGTPVSAKAGGKGVVIIRYKYQ
tara:strand:+ start:43 stop:1245 length:1203 start_codon:yes stop_codon:yes gene_type:complete